MRVWRNAGVPVDGTSGTSAGSAAKGDLLVDTTNANLYQNTNTLASPTWTQIAGGSGNTLDQAYDQGGVGAGRAITVNDGAITMTKNDTGTENVLELSASPSGAAAGAALAITCGANSTGAGITLANSGSGADISGTAGWNVTKAGVGTFDSLSVGQVTLVEDTLPAGTSCYIGRDNTGDTTINSLTGKTVNIAVAGTDVVTVAGAAVTIAQALTVSTGGAAITGNSTITGDLSVTGSLSFGGNWTVAATLTVDELILDTDGAAPAATNCYWVRDNAGDLTGNAVTGKTINLAIAGTDEYAFGAASVDLNGNHLDNAGYLILNEVTLPANTECYIGRDNTGDNTINAVTGKEVHLAVAAVDIVDVGAGEVVVNEAGGNVDFRVESDNVDPLFVCDGGIDVVGFGAAGDAAKFVGVSSTTRTLASAAEYSAVHIEPAGAVTTQGDASTSDYITSLYVAEPNITNGDSSE